MERLAKANRVLPSDAQVEKRPVAVGADTELEQGLAILREHNLRLNNAIGILNDCIGRARTNLVGEQDEKCPTEDIKAPNNLSGMLADYGDKLSRLSVSLESLSRLV